MGTEIKVIIFEDSQSLRTSLFHLIDGSAGFRCVGAYEDCLKLMENVAKDKPDVVLMDIQMPGISGIEAVSMLKEKYPDLKILMQTIFEDETKIFQSILAGASGYILKNTSPARILEFIKETYEGGAPMSPSVATKVLKMMVQQSPSAKQTSFDLSEREKDRDHQERPRLGGRMDRARGVHHQRRWRAASARSSALPGA